MTVERLPIEDEIDALLEAADPSAFDGAELLRGLEEEDARRLLVGLLRAVRRERAARYATLIEAGEALRTARESEAGS